MRSYLRHSAALALVLSLSITGLQTPLHADTPAAATESGVVGTQVQKRPWLYENSDVPIDAAWRFGVLPNGLRYAIRKNGVPPGQVSIRLRVDAGSLMERPGEAGYAHFMEHLTFRGSKHVPDGQSKLIWQRLGVTFGSDSNAQTTFTGTTYAVDLPQATDASINESMQILAGMMAEPNIIDSSVNAERSIVLAEMREGAGAQQRIMDANRQFLFAGQPMGDHAPIGKVDDLNAATAAKMRAFHDRWYRPENTVISISGDMEPAALEKLLKANFAGWKDEGQAAPMPDFGMPSDKYPETAVVAEPGAPAGISMAWLRPWKPRADTIIYNQNKLGDMLALAIVNRRLEQAARSGGSFLSASVDQQDISRSVDGTFLSLTPVGDDWAKALTDVRAILEDAKATPPTQEEIDREYAQLDTALAIQVENADTEASAKQASDIAGAVDIRETTVSPQAALDIFRSGKPGMTPEFMLDATRRLLTSGVVRALLLLPQAQPGAQEKLAAALKAPVAAAKDVRLSAKMATIDDLPKLGSPATVVKREQIGLNGMEIVTFSNGVKLTLFANDAETEKVRIAVRWGHGQQDFSPTKAEPMWAANYALVASGIGDLGQQQLDDITNGRRLGFDFSIDDNAFEFAAVTRPADYKDQLKLFATKLMAPRWDDAPVERLKAGLIAASNTAEQSADGVLGRDLGYLLHAGDVRFRTPDKGEIMALTPDAFRKTWEPRMAEGPIEVQIFGQVNPDDAIAAVAATLGALPPRPDKPVPKVNLQMGFPAHNETPVVLRHKGDKDQAAAIVSWPTSGGFAGTKEARQLEVLTQIFNDRLFEKIRVADAAAYSPSVQNSWPFSSESGGYILVNAQVKPEKLGYVFDMIKATAADLVANPVSADELQRAVAPMRQQLLRASTGNAFWMAQMEGATVDRRYVDAMMNLGKDMLGVTPQDVQALAQKYLTPGKSWSLEVLPEGVEGK